MTVICDARLGFMGRVDLTGIYRRCSFKSAYNKFLDVLELSSSGKQPGSKKQCTISHPHISQEVSKSPDLHRNPAVKQTWPTLIRHIYSRFCHDPD